MNYYKQLKGKILNKEAYDKIKDYSKEKNTVITYYEIGEILHQAGKHYGKFYSEICLVDQAFVKNPDITVQQLLDQNNAEIVRFVRFEKGEGLQKREENFAEEVAKQMNQ